VQTSDQTDEDVFLLLDGKDDEGLHDLLLEHADAGVDGPAKIGLADSHFVVEIVEMSFPIMCPLAGTANGRHGKYIIMHI
jgi:hypothetical protein